MAKTTSELLETLRNSRSIDNYLKESQEDMFSGSVSEYLQNLIKKLGIKKKLDIIKGAGMSGYGYQLIDGRRPNTERDYLIRLAFGMKLNLEETQKMLKATGFPPLYPRLKRDSIIISALEKISDSDDGECVANCDITLDDHGEKPLDGGGKGNVDNLEE